MLVALFAGLALWILYGLMVGDAVIVVANGVGCALVGVVPVARCVTLWRNDEKNSNSTRGEMATGDENHFEYALGFAVVRRWADLSRETQQLLFDEATAGDDSLRGALAAFLHGSIPKPPIR